MEIKEIRDWVLFSCECNRCPEIYSSIKIEWSNRLTSSMGVAILKNGQYTIRFSALLFARANEEEKRQTVIHESCHVIDSVINNCRMSHGITWKKCMLKADSRPEVYHSISNKGLVTKYLYSCPCGKEFRLSTRLHKGCEEGRRRICNKCKGVLKFQRREK